jgi:hypothetical protein
VVSTTHALLKTCINTTGETLQLFYPEWQVPIRG